MINNIKPTNISQNIIASDLAVQLNKGTERDVSQFTFKAYLNNSIILEKFSTWLLAGVGASCALIIANINSISQIIGQSNIKYSLLILVCSGLFGFLSKYYAIQISIILSVDDYLRNALPLLLGAHIEEEKKIHSLASENNTAVNTIPNIIGAMRIVNDFLPWYSRKKALEGFEKGLEDPLHGYKKGMKFLSFQTLATVAEFSCFLAFVVMVALSI